MKPVTTVAEMQAIDAAALTRVSEATLVRRAGTAVGVAAIDLMGGAYGRRVAVVAGKGNNGADGRVAAAWLRDRGARVAVLDAATLAPGDALDGPLDLVIDAAFGTGFRGEYVAPRPPAGATALAVDVPSGLAADTGVASGAPMRADRTVTFAALKPGLLLGDGPDLAGEVRVADIGLDAGRAAIRLVEDDDIDALVPPRPRTTNKWRAAVAVVAGSPGMLGAPTMCAGGAYRAGAGMVRLLVPGASGSDLPAGEAVAVPTPATGWAAPALETVARCAVTVVGPGLGRGEDTAEQIARLVRETSTPLVLDADAVVALGEAAAAAKVIAGRPAGAGPVVLTPHDGEFAGLRGAPPAADRVADVRALAAEIGAVVLLKGSTTIVADPGGRVLLAAAGSPRLATAGTGDVLSGIIAALISRGVAVPEAAALGAHVHGRAASAGRAVGLVAGDLPDLVSDWLSARPARPTGATT